MHYDMDSRPGISYKAGFFILLALLGAGLIIGSLVSGGIWVAMTGKGILSMQKDMMDPAYLSAIRTVQLVSTFLIFFVPAWLASLILSKRPMKLMGFQMAFNRKQITLVVLIMLAALPMVGGLSKLNELIPLPAAMEKIFKDLEDTYTEQVKVLSHIRGFGDYLISLLIMAIAPAAFEETFFRGGMQNLLQRGTGNKWLSIIITSILFSAIHFSWYGFIVRFALGVVLGSIYAYSGSLWLSIWAHALNNAIVVTQLYLLSRQGKPIDDAMKDSYPIWVGIIAMGLLIALISYFKKVSDQVRISKKSTLDQSLDEKWLA